MNGAERRIRELEALVAPHGSALVAFSGGVDSSLALAVAVRALSRERVLAVTSCNETYLPSELEKAREFAASLGVKHEVVETRELDDPNYASNPTNRCYFCKSTLYTELGRMARERGYGCVVDGANADDEGDWRPGRKAARELGVLSPLAEAGVGKDEVRRLARHLGLPTWDKPALACLSSRFPYGQRITPEKLSQVARSEEFLRSRGFRQVRVRHHGEVARLEVAEEEMERAFRMREEISSALREAGFAYVALDLSGYRSGSLNATLKRKKKSLPVLSG
ncbi:Pyridinium-3,5-bisthiocarboxylic acid mononucleotide synthase [Rubrobacter xylanophilus DSM 9941]|uniref:ATP-dependent sacrificial sulfur transferase LarE n=1 Tax=Rubrobacter xylanophilus TaxID=49319 RepID=UPI001C63DD83|nr:ATP-dependent sacrificial sulfur transferase LarE [Rubrobacter xylanophilus]QYJ14320.1 Pyridinium-3,5-bisthiocarboxylic acid mononucleotide synthase [Rubrobacter xylanophilus DSM 9941]